MHVGISLDVATRALDLIIGPKLSIYFLAENCKCLHVSARLLFS